MSFCARLSRTVAVIKGEYLRSPEPWFLGYSGGKDSSALLKLVYLALLDLKARPKPITVVYCDTGVEIPIVQKLVSGTLQDLSKEAQDARLPFTVRIATPNLADRFFVKVIGRGYPPPSNKFRWCTDKLRVNPVNRLLRNRSEKVTVLLSVRRGESIERDKLFSVTALAGSIICGKRIIRTCAFLVQLSIMKQRMFGGL